MSNHIDDANKMVGDTPGKDAVARINEYLGVGGLFNPEILNVQQHEAVRDTLIQARDELNAANDRIKRLEKATQERDKEWFQVIESILGFHPVSMTEALRIGIERIKKHKQHIKRLEEAGDEIVDYNIGCGCGQDGPCRACRMACEAWEAAKEAKP